MEKIQKAPRSQLTKGLFFGFFKCLLLSSTMTRMLDRIRNFESKAKLGARAVMEFRDSSWWSKQAIKEIESIGVAFCSVDAPKLPTKLVSINDTTYLRLHGSTNGIIMFTQKENLTSL